MLTSQATYPIHIKNLRDEASDLTLTHLVLRKKYINKFSTWFSVIRSSSSQVLGPKVGKEQESADLQQPPWPSSVSPLPVALVGLGIKMSNMSLWVWDLPTVPHHGTQGTIPSYP